MDSARRRALQIVALGLLGQVIGFVANALTQSLASPRLAQAFALLMVFGSAGVVIGCVALARAKGRAWSYGLLGFFSVVGVAILWYGVQNKTPR